METGAVLSDGMWNAKSYEHYNRRGKDRMERNAFTWQLPGSGTFVGAAGDSGSGSGLAAFI